MSQRRPSSHRIPFRHLVESVASRVDRENGILFGVKVCGLESKRGRSYTPEALKAAIPLYEGVKVNIDHPAEDDNGPRDADCGFGILKNVREAKDGGLIADLHFLKSHPMAERIMEAAERMPQSYGLSHNAYGDEDRQRHLITKINRVLSVDLVRDPATNKSLFEGATVDFTPKFSPRQKLADMVAKPIEKAAKKLNIEADPMNEDMMAPPEEAPADAGGGDWKADLVAAIGKLVSSEDDGDHKMAQKIMGMLKPGAAPVATEEADDEPGKGEEAKEKKDDKTEEKKESARAEKGNLMESRIAKLEKENADLKASQAKRAKAIKLCEAAKVKPDENVIRIVTTLQEADAKTYLQQIRSAGMRPRSQGRDTVTALQESDKPLPKTPEEFAARCKR